jgi:hypothetical protein
MIKFPLGTQKSTSEYTKKFPLFTQKQSIESTKKFSPFTKQPYKNIPQITEN